MKQTTQSIIDAYLIKERFKNQFINPQLKPYSPSWVKDNLVNHLILK